MAGDGRADESAVINQSAVLDHENLRERLVGKLLFPVGRHISDPRADDAAGHQPQRHVGDGVAGDVREPRAARGRPQAGEKRHRHHHAIPADGQ